MYMGNFSFFSFCKSIKSRNFLFFHFLLLFSVILFYFHWLGIQFFFVVMRKNTQLFYCPFSPPFSLNGEKGGRKYLFFLIAPKKHTTIFLLLFSFVFHGNKIPFNFFWVFLSYFNFLFLHKMRAKWWVKKCYPLQNIWIIRRNYFPFVKH